MAGVDYGGLKSFVMKIFNMINKKIIIEEIQKFINENDGLTTLYHGSKTLFNKFDINKINTGQHSQDFGYGLYFTTDKETAKFYANELSNFKTPAQKYDDIILSNNKNEILYQYLKDNQIISAKRILNGLIQNNDGNIDEWKNLLRALDIVQRYAYVYTVNVSNPNFISKDDYTVLKHELNVNDKQMNNILLEKGYNGIQYKINSFGLNKTRNFNDEYNVVIIDDNILNITNIEKVEFEGTLKLDNFNNKNFK